MFCHSTACLLPFNASVLPVTAPLYYLCTVYARSSAASGESLDGGEGLGLAEQGQGEIRGSAQLDVWCEVIPPFTLMPRGALQVRPMRMVCALQVILCARAWIA